MSKKGFRYLALIGLLVAILFTTSILSLCIGSVNIPVQDIPALLAAGKGSIEYSILFDIRLPRILLGLAVGSALSLSGVILQGLFRNPLVEPYTLGISGGAALGVCIALALKLNIKAGLLAIPASGFAGAILIMAIIYLASVRKKLLKVQGLLLTGVMLSFISSSLIMLFMALARLEDLHGIVFWIMGSLEEPHHLLINAMLIISAVGLLGSYFFCADLNALSLGEEEALHLGVNTERTKKLLFLIASVLTGCAVSVGGVIGFVGLVIPHFIRMLTGADHRLLLVASSLAGASFLVACDTLARTIIAPQELPVGVITGIIGGSLFVFFLNKNIAVWGSKR